MSEITEKDLTLDEMIAQQENERRRPTPWVWIPWGATC